MNIILAAFVSIVADSPIFISQYFKFSALCIHVFQSVDTTGCGMHIVAITMVLFRFCKTDGPIFTKTIATHYSGPIYASDNGLIESTYR